MLEFNFPLLSDPDRSIAALLDVKRPRTHPLAGIPRRVTYLIDPELRIVRFYDVGGHIQGHADEVLEDLHRISQKEG